MAIGIASKPPAAKPRAKRRQAGRSPQQLRGRADRQLAQAANRMLPAATDAFSQPFDWDRINQMSPVQDDWQKYVDEGVAGYNQAFDARMNPIFAQQSEEFEQSMANKGIPMGSELYNREKSRMEQTQADARTQGYSSGRSQAFQEANTAYGIGSAAQANALGLGMQQRNQPLNEMQALWGAGYSPERQMMDDQQSHERWMMKNTPRGGGGGGSAPAWAQAGYGSYQEMLADQEARRRANQQWDWQNNPQYRTQSGPSYAAQLGGGILGAGLGILGNWAGSDSGSGVISGWF